MLSSCRTIRRLAIYLFGLTPLIVPAAQAQIPPTDAALELAPILKVDPVVMSKDANDKRIDPLIGLRFLRRV